MIIKTLIFTLKVWNLFRNTEAVKQMVMSRIQEETLRTYLLMYSTVYKTVSLSTLCNLFELKKSRVYALIRLLIFLINNYSTKNKKFDLIKFFIEKSMKKQIFATLRVCLIFF